jgi:hypothetical protein
MPADAGIWNRSNEFTSTIDATDKITFTNPCSRDETIYPALNGEFPTTWNFGVSGAME